MEGMPDDHIDTFNFQRSLSERGGGELWNIQQFLAIASEAAIWKLCMWQTAAGLAEGANGEMALQTLGF